MACFTLNPDDWVITIPSYREELGVTFYDIKFRIGGKYWFVRHRYKDFVNLHESLVTDHSLSRDMLPPKKVIGNRDPKFIEKRRTELEKYLIYIFNFLQKTMPKSLVFFLSFEKYDVMFMLQNMSASLTESCSTLVSKGRMHGFTLIQVHALSERIRIPCPPLASYGLKCDFSNILEFCSNLQTISITGEDVSSEFSNINFKNMSFELSAFKSVENLALFNLDINSLINANDLRMGLKSFSVINCRSKSINNILLCDELHKDWKVCGEDKIWRNIIEIDFTNNDIEVLDGSLSLIPNVEGLNLNMNKVQHLENLNCLHNLQRLHLSSNRIEELSCLYLQLKNIKFIDLSQNQILSLKGFKHLDSLQGFNLASNSIKDLDEIIHISNLPMLDYVVLTGNPISTIVDYRVKVLEKFGVRYSRLCLDNEQSTQKELDTVAVLQALRFVKEGRHPNFGKV